MENLNIEYHTKGLIRKALAKSNTIKEASELLEITERSLYNMMARYSIKKAKVSPSTNN
jgi:transcriptional regulator with PAS, ATPase and Fis domain